MEKFTEQEIIIANNLHANHLGGWCNNCPYKSLGNVIHWIYTYAKLDIAERIQVGNDVVELYGEKYADIKWDDKLQMPIFEFTNHKNAHSFILENQRVYLKWLNEAKPENRYEQLEKIYEKHRS